MYLYVLFILAFVLRLINLNQSLWLDETIVAKVVKTIPFHLIPFQFSPGDFHPPMYYMFISLWSSLFGYSEIAFRMPSVFFSLIAGWYVYKIGAELKGKSVGLWAAAFFLFNPLIIYYSQEARMYMMATMFLSGALYYFLLSTKEIQVPNPNSKIRNIVLFNLFSALAMFTFYGSAFFIGGMIIVGFFKSRRLFVYLFIGLFISLLFLSPLLYQQILNAKAGLADLKNWSMALGKVEIKNVLMIFIKFATGRLSWYPKWSYYLVAGIPTVVTWAFIAFGMKKNKLLAFLFFFPILAGLIVSFVAPMMMYFRFLYLILVMSILFPLGTPHKGKFLGWIHPVWSQSVLVGMAIVFSLVYLLNPQFHREDWKGLAQELNVQTRVYMILPSSDPVSYYRNDVSVFELRDIKKSMVPESINVIPYTSEIYGLNYTQLLQEKGCIMVSQMHFRGDVTLEKWKCLRNA